MNQLKKTSCFVFLIFFLFPFRSFNQNIEVADTSDIKLIKAAREIMTSAGTCALITLDEEGRPRVRTMDPFAPDSDFTVWYGTNSKSRKVNQINMDPRVTLYYLDSDASGYVMIHGLAQLVDDQKEKDQRWKDEWIAFYPNKTEDYLLIKVTPIWMEVSSSPRGIVGNPVTWETPVVFFDSIK